MTQLYFVSVPGDSSYTQAQNIVQTQQLGEVRRLNVPELKVGTLDALMVQSENLQKLDSSVEQTTVKLGRMMSDLLTPNHRDTLDESYQAGGRSIEAYVNGFEWDYARYPSKKLTLQSIAEIIEKEVGKIDDTLKQKQQAYNNAKQALSTHDRKFTGSLIQRSLVGLVEKRHIVQDSDYLTTLLVVVPKSQREEWLNTYHTLVQFVVPGSSEKIFEDEEYFLYNVVCFKRISDEFRIKAREKRFIVRDFEWEEGKSTESDKERVTLDKDVQKQWALLVRWCNINFAEAYAASVHVKVLRVFVESVLRFSLPIDFCPMIVRPSNKKTDKKLRAAFDQAFSSGDDANYKISGEDSATIAGMSALVGGEEYHPYVFVDSESLTRESVRDVAKNY